MRWCDAAFPTGHLQGTGLRPETALLGLDNCSRRDKIAISSAQWTKEEVA